jgi:hypothetical protein
MAKLGGEIEYVTLTIPLNGRGKSLADAVTALNVEGDRHEFYVHKISSDGVRITLQAKPPLDVLPLSRGYEVSAGGR